MSILYTCPFFLFFVLHFHDFCRILIKDKYFCLFIIQKTVRRYIMPEMERRLRKNPSRKECEDIIRRILMTEMLEKGKNEHFKTATDFMKYFESLDPASDSLTRYSVPSSPLICQRIQTATSSSIRLPNSWIRIRNFPSCCKKARHM